MKFGVPVAGKGWTSVPMAAKEPKGGLKSRAAGAKAAVETIVVPEARDRWRSSVSRTYTPDAIVSVLTGAFAGDLTAQFELFDLMEDTWPRLSKNLNELKRAVKSLDWTLQPFARKGDVPTPAAQERAAFVEDLVWSMNPAPDADENDFEDGIYDLLDAWGKGISVQEIDWELRNGVFAPRCLRWISPRYYGYPSDKNRLMLNTREKGVHLPPERLNAAEDRNAQGFVRFPENKFVIGISKNKSGHPTGAALLRPLAWWWCASNFGAEWLLNYAQLFGQPIRWATYDPARSGVLNRVCEMLENMGSAGWAAFPDGTKLELKEAAKSGADNPQAFLLTLADETADILILGQTLTTSAGDKGSQALGRVHFSVRGDIIQAAAEWAASKLKQLIRAILILNYGDANECPWFAPSLKQVKDAKAMAERDCMLLDRGIAMPKGWFHERHDIPMPAEGEEVIVRSPAMGGEGQMEPGEPDDDGSRAAAVQAKDAQDKLIDSVLEDLTGVEAKWLGGVKPFFARLVEAAQDDKISDEEFERVLVRARAQIPELFRNIDADALQAAMEAHMGAAVVNGAVKGFTRRRKRRGA